MTQVSLGVFPIGGPTTLFPTKCPTFPDNLDEAYGRYTREIRRTNRVHAHRLLQYLVAGVRPPRVEELAEVLMFDSNTEGIPKLNPGRRWGDQEEAVLFTWSSLVIISKDGG